MPARSLDQIVNLCKRRGFVFPGSAAYGGLGSFWDYGPLGVEMLRNVKEAWWKDSVYARDDMEGLDAAILMSRKVWQHSGHEATFSDPLVDCKKCHSRFRSDHVIIQNLEGATRDFNKPEVMELWLSKFRKSAEQLPEPDRGESLVIIDKFGKAERKSHELVVELEKREKAGEQGVWDDPRLVSFASEFQRRATDFFELPSRIPGFRRAMLFADVVTCPKCGSHEFTDERKFNLMFQTHVGPVSAEPGSDEELAHRVYLRPETAQGIFMNFAHVQRAMARKVPFGIAQMGKAFRNEITPGNFIFRTREFEQMEIEFFIKPPQFVQEGEKTDEQWHREWIERRYEWWLKYSTPSASTGGDARVTERFRKREQTPDELAHYAKATTDIEYLFPGSLGWGEIEGVANRTDYDLSAHSKDVPEDDLKRLKLEPNKDSNEKFDYFDPDAKQRYIPWVIEPSAGVTRAVLTFLCEAYHEEMVSEPTKQEVDQVKSDVAMIIKNAEKKIKQAEKDAEKGKQPKHDPAAVQAFIDKLGEARDGLPDSLMAVEDAFNHEGAQNLEPVKKFRPWLEKLVERVGRRVLRLHPALAPVKLAVFPLKKNKPELVELAKSIKAKFARDFRVVYDDSAGIGRLYRRQDEIGTPFCITVDFQSLEDDTVTVRERDSMEQVRVNVDELEAYLLPRLR